jgi:hypothetical protein
MNDQLFEFDESSNTKKKKQIIDDVRNILIVELPGTKEGEGQLKQLFEELRDRGYKCKIMT